MYDTSGSIREDLLKLIDIRQKKNGDEGSYKVGIETDAARRGNVHYSNKNIAMHVD